MASDLKVKIRDLISPGIDKRIREQKNLSPVFKKIGRFEMRQTRRRIRITKESPDGNAWSKWKPSTVKHRIKKGNASQGLLYDTKEMHDFFLLSHSNTEMRLKAGTDYAKFLQFGTTKMVARPFMGWSDASIEFIKRSFKRHFK